MFSCFRDIVLKVYWGHEFDLSGSRDHWILHRPFPIGGPLKPSLYIFIYYELIHEVQQVKK